MTKTERGFRLSTGREFYANQQLVSVDHDARQGWGVYHGYDGGVDVSEWTPLERRELADYMIALWTQFRDEGAP